MTILGIETSCDETSAAVLRNLHVLSNIIATQEVHEKFGGVVPEIASRAHQQNIVPVVDEAIKNAGVNLKEIDAIAFTEGPGLVGALMVGGSFAKGLCIGLKIPMIGVHHLKAHVAAHYIHDAAQKIPTFPFLCLLVSGGHTQLIKVNNHTQFELLGETLDDAAGEAFDKAAKVLGLPYPGGPLIDRLARLGNPNKFAFAKPQIPDLNFSFSGIKTSILYSIRDSVKSRPNFIEEELNHLCASIQKTIVDVLMMKVRKSISKTGIKRIAVAGGVSANSSLRSSMNELQQEGCEVFLPKAEFCTDNAAMIAAYGHFAFLEMQFSELSHVPHGRLEI